MTTELTLKDIYSRLDALGSDAQKVACSLDIGGERTEAFALYTVLHRLLRRGAAVHIHDAINPLLVDHNISAQAIHKFEQSEKFSVTNQQYRVELTSYDPQTRQVDHDSIDLTAEQYKALAQEVAPNSNYPELPDSWASCQAIADIPEVDAALRDLVEDSTGDNGVRVVQAVMHALAGSPEIAHG